MQPPRETFSDCAPSQCYYNKAQYLHLSNNTLQQAESHVVYCHTGYGEVSCVGGPLSHQAVQHCIHPLHELAVLLLCLNRSIVVLHHLYIVVESLQIHLLRYSHDHANCEELCEV